MQRHNRRLMNNTRPRLRTRVWILVLGMALLRTAAGSAQAQSSQHLSMLQPEGMPGLPVITGITQVTNGVNVTWDGPAGYYQLFQKRSFADPTWQALGTAFNLTNNETITELSSNAFFRVSGPSPQYAGAQVCAECHAEVLNTVVHTAHFGAFTNALFAAQGGQTNGSCLACHTVGYQLPSGFLSQSATPQLAGVQCENCHGPAANHAANPGDPSVRPRVEVAGTMCGGCHNAQSVPSVAASYHPPYYEEWSASPHQSVLPELKADFTSNPNVYISTCGRCHSGTVREAFLENELLPDAQEASVVGIACATCHDPHEQAVYTNVLSGVITNPVTGVVVTNGPAGSTYTTQLRNPLSSLQDYHVTGDFTTNYNPAINVCAQCHNDRGASYKDTSRSPHHSPQYNMLIGTVGVLDSSNPDVPHFEPASHAMFITNQCVGCHMQTAPFQSPAQPAHAGHGFVVNSYAVCAQCHGSSANASNAVIFVQGLFTNRIQEVQTDLNQWATSKAPALLGTTNYGTRAWEYTTPGELSPGGPGPSAAQQAQIPLNIKMARFNLYLVYHDGSLGVHNPLYSLTLLDTAQSLVQAELSP